MNIGETLSSDTLFHFTGERKYLENIIENGFFPRYSKEDLSMFSIAFGDEINTYDFGIPMVCFCDIPLSKLKEHISVYRGYGIGCTKAWGIEKGITPVVYAKPTSETVQSLQNAHLILKSFKDIDIENTSNFRILKENLLRLMKFIKPYEGRFERKGKKFENKRFYDEREWRFVPNIKENEHANLWPWISKDLIYWLLLSAKSILKNSTFNWQSENPGDLAWVRDHLMNSPDLLSLSDDEISDRLFDKLCQEQNKTIEDTYESLKLDPLSIKYIVVELEEDIVPIVELLEKKFRNDYYSDNTLKRLMTRIITLDQIRDDF